MTRSHSSDRLISAGSGWLRAYGMRGMNRYDMLVVCTDVTATLWCVWDWRSTYVVWSCYDWNAQMSAMPGMCVQSAVCADVARCGSGMLGMWPRGSRLFFPDTVYVACGRLVRSTASIISSNVISLYNVRRWSGNQLPSHSNFSAFPVYMMTF